MRISPVSVMYARRAAGGMTAIGLALLMIAMLVGGQAVPAYAQENTPQGDVTSTTVDDATTTTGAADTTTTDPKKDDPKKDDPKDTTTTTDDPKKDAPKDTTTTTDPKHPTTTTTLTPPPATAGAVFEGSCVAGDGGTTQSVIVNITGEPGAGGAAFINGSTHAYTIGADGTATIRATGVVGDNFVKVSDTAYGPIADGVVTISDCTPRTPVTEDAAIAGVCDHTGDTTTYPLTVTIVGEAGATGVVTANGVDHGYVIGADGTTVLTIEGVSGSNDVVVTDDEIGVITSSTIALEDCTPTPPTTVPPTPGVATAEVSFQCTYDGLDLVYTVVATISGDVGATGVVIVDGHAEPFTIGADGTGTVTWQADDSTAVVEIIVDGQGTLVGPSTLTAQDCTPEPPIAPVTVTAAFSGQCTVEAGAAVHTVSVTVTGEPGATGTIEVDGELFTYTIDDDGVHTRTAPGREGEVTVEVIDFTAGVIASGTVLIENCGPRVEVNSDATSAPQPVRQVPIGDDVEALAAQPDTPTELPFTGPADQPLAATGLALLAGGSLLLFATRDEETPEAPITW